MLADVQNLGGLSVIYATDPAWYIGDPTNYGFIALHRHTGNPAPAPPKSLTWTVAAGNHPQLNWLGNSERDIASYRIYRSPNGTSNWQLKATVSAGTTSWTDNEVTYTPPWKFVDKVYYHVKAVDNASQPSDESNIIWVPIAGLNNWKRGAANDLPTAFKVSDAYPNPFNPTTQIKFDLPEDSHVTLNVFDVLGRKVGEIANGNYTAGYHSATWNPSTSSGQVLASGVYFARFTATDARGNVKLNTVTKLLLMK